MDKVLELLKDPRLTYPRKRHELAAAAENSLPYLKVGPQVQALLDSGVIDDLGEGHAPYRPRYILPDYVKFIRQGSRHLDLAPPGDLYEAVNALLILYRHVPSVTGYPVYLGQIDDVLERFVDTVGPAELERLLRMFLINIDRTLPDAFVHMNIGPRATTIGRLVLKLEGELKKAVPNLSLKFGPETPPDFARQAVAAALETSKPYFVNHQELTRVFGGDYGIASCYNTLKIGGGSFTLVRLNFKEVARRARDFEDFMRDKLPEAVDGLCELINARIRFIVEEMGFFDASFLAQEGLIDLKNFTAMAGFFGLYEGVQALTGGLRMGHDRAADQMAEAVMARAHELVKAHPAAHGEAFGGKIGVHAQSGIDTDVEVTAGVRIRIGDEPGLFDQIRLESTLQRFFDTGVSDIYIFDSTARDNLDGVLRVVRGAMKHGLRIMALNTSDSELIRITGYLVKRCDAERCLRGEQVREGTVKLGADSLKNNRTLERRVRTFREGECQ